MTINSYLTTLASSSIIRAEEKIKIASSISNLQRNLNYRKDYFSAHYLFGSYSRDTILPRSYDLNSDIDYLVIFNDNSFSPNRYFDWLRTNVIEFYYSRSEIYKSHPTIVLDLNHIKFEIVPAIYKNNQLLIPNKTTSSQQWLQTDPIGFNAHLTRANTNNNSLIKPLIRIMKIWNAKHNYPYDSYELEQKIVSTIFYSGALSRLLKDYFVFFTNSLQTNIFFDTQKKQNAVNRLKSIVNEAIRYEQSGNYFLAETTLAKLFT